MVIASDIAGTLCIVVIVLGVIAFWIRGSVTKAKQERERERVRKEQLFAEARAFLARVKQSRALPLVETTIMLKAEEVAFYSAPSVLHETRAVRHYQAGHSGFRVAKGVYIGGTRGTSTSTQEWSEIDKGNLTVTNQRLIFDGGAQDRVVQLSKIVSAELTPTGVEVSVEGRQKSMVFEADNRLILILILRICCQTEDPRDLSQTNLNVTFNE